MKSLGKVFNCSLRDAASTKATNQDLETWLAVVDKSGLPGLRRTVKVDETLVEPRLEAIPGLGSLTAGGLPGGDAKGLGWHADRPLDHQVLLLGPTDQVGTDFLQRLDTTAGESDADAVDGHLGLCQGPLPVSLKAICTIPADLFLSTPSEW